ncbi:MAG: hypothetical protein U0807_14535 [Candidatus Binatia bacterium]
MAMFRKSRRRRPPVVEEADRVEEAGADEARAPASGRGWAAALIERLRAVAAETASPEEALEPALHLILEAMRVQAGALCLFDARHGILRLTAERGLSDEGCHRLRTVRRGDPTTWDMPLHGLVNRAAYLIESAAQNRYVPRLIEGRVPVRTVACVPFYGAHDPLGTLVLVAAAPRSLAERDIVALTRPLQELAVMVQAVRRMAGVPDEVVSPGLPPLRIDVVALSAERDTLRAERAELAAELAAGVSEREQLALELTELASARDHLEADLDAVLIERDALAADLERVQQQAERVAELEAALGRAGRVEDRQDSALAGALAERDAHKARVAELEQTRADLARRADALAAELERARTAAAGQVAASERRVAEQTSEIARLSKRLEEATVTTRHALDQEERERLRLEAELETAIGREAQIRAEIRAEEAQHRDALAVALEASRAADAARAVAEREIETARTRLAALETTAENAERVAQDAERERARLALALEAAAAREADLRAQLEAVDVGRAAGGEAEIAAAHEALRLAEATRATAEAAAAASTSRLEHVQAALARAEARLHEHEAERSRLAGELRAVAMREQQLREEIVAAAARRLTTSDAELGAARGAVQRAEAERAQAHADAEAARNERRSAEAQLAEVVAELERTRTDRDHQVELAQAVAAERAQLDAALATATTTEGALRATLAAAEREIAALRAEHERTRVVAQAQVEGESTLRGRLDALAGERDAARTALTGVEAERDHLRTEIAAQAAAHARLEEALGRETSARAHLAAELVEVRRQHQEQAAATAPAPERDAAAAKAPTASSAPAARPVQVVRLVSADGEAVGAEPRERSADSKVVVVLDKDPAWKVAAAEGREIILLSPAAEAAAEIAALAPDRVIVNLAVPEALGVAMALRAAGCRARLWGAIAAAGHDRVLGLGMIEPAVHPLDPEVVVDVLGGFVTRGGRVIVSGADVDGLMSLRQALSRQRVGVTMAWDAKQVADLLPVVRPNAVVVDLDLPRRDGYAIVAGLGAVEPPAHAVLIGGVEDAPKAFATLLGDARYTERAVGRDTLVEAALARSQDPPVAAKTADAAKAGARGGGYRVRQVAWGK